MRHLMIDLETMSSRPNAVVVSIGLTAFDKTAVEPTGLRVVVNREEQKRMGRHEDPDTMAWWAKQTPEARAVFDEKQIPVTEATFKVQQYVTSYTDGPRHVEPWGNGADFDLPIITGLFADFGVPVPWKFYNHRCFRTLKHLLPVRYKIATEELKNPLKHDCLADARWQAEVASRLLRSPNLALEGMT